MFVSISLIYIKKYNYRKRTIIKHKPFLRIVFQFIHKQDVSIKKNIDKPIIYFSQYNMILISVISISDKQEFVLQKVNYTLNHFVL